MVTRITIARPYAKAVFLTAKATGSYSKWFSILECLSYAVTEDSSKKFFSNPTVSGKKKLDFISSILSSFFDNKEWFELVFLLIENKRLLYVPEIFVQYKYFCENEQGIVRAEIISAYDISEDQSNFLISYLSEKLNKKVELNYTVDESLLCGFKIKYDGFLIDKTISGKLNSLSNFLFKV